MDSFIKHENAINIQLANAQQDLIDHTSDNDQRSIHGFGQNQEAEISQIRPQMQTEHSNLNSHRQFIADVQENQFDAMQMNAQMYDER